MDIDNTQGGAEPSPASAGSHGSNGLVAYYAHGSEYDTGCEFEFVTLLREHAEASGGTVATLVQITDEEREAIRRAVLMLDGVEDLLADAGALDAEAVTTLRGLLERTK
jgi:hypothetical protein